jgi:hypothetical protein
MKAADAAFQSGSEDDMAPFRQADVARWRALHNAGLTLTPEQVARTSVADAVRKTAQWNDHMANAATQANADLSRGIAGVHKDYGDGMKWVRLGANSAFSPEDYAAAGYSFPQDAEGNFLVQHKHAAVPFREKYPTLEAAQASRNYFMSLPDLEAGLNAEGQAMGHCVGGYCDEVANNGTSIYSLRDANNNPHVTVEARPGRPTDREQQVAFRQMTPENYAKRYPDAANLPQDIVQIKGKQNAAPIDKYLPYVQDFVKNGNWGQVGDLRNTGLTDISRLPMGARFPGQRFMTGAEISEAMKNGAPPTGYAHGGSVVPRYSKKAKLLAMLED